MRSTASTVRWASPTCIRSCCAPRDREARLCPRPHSRLRSCSSVTAPAIVLLMSRAVLLAVLLLSLSAAVRAEEVIFTEVSPYSRNEELMRRLLPRAEAAALAEGLAQRGQRL